MHPEFYKRDVVDGKRATLNVRTSVGGRGVREPKPTVAAIAMWVGVRSVRTWCPAERQN